MKQPFEHSLFLSTLFLSFELLLCWPDPVLGRAHHSLLRPLVNHPHPLPWLFSFFSPRTESLFFSTALFLSLLAVLVPSSLAEAGAETVLESKAEEPFADAATSPAPVSEPRSTRHREWRNRRCGLLPKELETVAPTPDRPPPIRNRHRRHSKFRPTHGSRTLTQSFSSLNSESLTPFPHLQPPCDAVLPFSLSPRSRALKEEKARETLRPPKKEKLGASAPSPPPDSPDPDSADAGSPDPDSSADGTTPKSAGVEPQPPPLAAVSSSPASSLPSSARSSSLPLISLSN